MTKPPYPATETGKLGREIYESRIREKVEPQHIGQYIVIDVESGGYVVDADIDAASDRAHVEHPDGVFYGMRVGYAASGTIGASAPALHS